MTQYEHYSAYPKDKWRWPSFSPAEMACRGTGKIKIDERSMDMLQQLRNKIGCPFIVNSAYRSPEHNRRVGGAKSSQHLQAKAFDISMSNLDPQEFIAAAESIGFQGIGTYPRGASTFVHIDSREGRARWGKPIPRRESRFQPEEKKQPAKAAAKQTAVGGVSTGAAMEVAGQLKAAQWSLPENIGVYIGLIGVAITIGVIVYTFVIKDDD
ncbi:MAG: D-Ala-D-Ala carboxypeptidase family metallohydrolase [Pseudomonadota bacterium]